METENKPEWKLKDNWLIMVGGFLVGLIVFVICPRTDLELYSLLAGIVAWVAAMIACLMEKVFKNSTHIHTILSGVAFILSALSSLVLAWLVLRLLS